MRPGARNLAGRVGSSRCASAASRAARRGAGDHKAVTTPLVSRCELRGLGAMASSALARSVCRFEQASGHGAAMRGVWLAGFLALCALASLPLPAVAQSMLPLQASPLVDVGERLPNEYLSERFPVCAPTASAGSSVSLGDALGERVVVVATYYVGCNPGRTDAPTYAALASKLSALPPTAGKVTFLSSLKGGVNSARCESWAALGGAAGDQPITIDDEHRSLHYKLFEDRHPEYALIDHCGTFRYRIGPLYANATGSDAAAGESPVLNAHVLEDFVEELVAEVGQECPGPAGEGDGAVVRTGGSSALDIVYGARYGTPQHETIKEPATEVPVATCVTAGDEPRVAFGESATVVAAGISHHLSFPRTLSINPLEPSELWVGNNNTDGVAVLTLGPDGVALPGLAGAQRRRDRAPYHYMDRLSQLSFDQRGFFATCQESTNNYEGLMRSNLFMGPTLYHADRRVLVTQMGEMCPHAPDAAESEDGSERCYFQHSDMLHESPQCMGIVHDPEHNTPYRNVYWAFDGLNSSLIRYDFEKPHGPGYLDHSLASVRRYPEVHLTRVAGVVGHLAMDGTKRVLYVADTGAGRVVAVSADSGRFEVTARSDLGGEFVIWSSLNSTFEYSTYACVDHYDLAAGLQHPAGVAVAEAAGVVFVGEHGSGHIVALDAHGATAEGSIGGAELARFDTGATGLMGLHYDAATSRLYYTDAPSDSVSFVDVTLCKHADVAGSGAGPVDGGAALRTGFLARVCGAENGTLGIAIDHVSHDDGYQNMTMLGVEYGFRTDCENINNDLLLMSGYLCHTCLPDPCAEMGHGACTNVPYKGYECACSGDYSGSDCHVAPSEEANGDGEGGEGSESEASGSTRAHVPVFAAAAAATAAGVLGASCAL